MPSVGYGSHVGERLRFYCASVLVQLAKSILWLVHRLFLIGILDIAGVKYGVRASEAIRRVSWRLVRWKRR
jgi:hypothetical protein